MIRQLILNFVSAFRKHNTYRMLTLLLLLWSGNSNAVAWTIAGFTLPAAELAELRSRYPTLTTATDLQQLLTQLARQRSFVVLRIVWHNDAWVVQGEVAATIAKIELKMVTHYLRSELETITEKYIGAYRCNQPPHATQTGAACPATVERFSASAGNTEHN